MERNTQRRLYTNIVSDSPDPQYPPDAYAPNGVLWWKLQTHPGTQHPFGDERKIAAWLAVNFDEGATFTIRDLRAALGEATVPHNAEHLNRRFRELRHDGWVMPSKKDDRTLPIGVYRLERRGWHPGLGERPKRGNVSQGTRRRVFERDGRRCVICGVGSGEPYPGEPEVRAVLTIGHRVPRERRDGSSDPNNLQAECKRCNEPVRQEVSSSEELVALIPDVRRLKTQELTVLLNWLQCGQRTRSRVDEVYDRARRLSAGERDELTARVRNILGG